MAKKFLYIAAVVAAAFLVSGWIPTKQYQTKKEIHIVTAAQTVWEIAEKYQPMQDMKMTTKNCEEPYICPVCDGEWKREQRKALDARRYKKEKAR